MIAYIHTSLKPRFRAHGRRDGYRARGALVWLLVGRAGRPAARRRRRRAVDVRRVRRHVGVSRGASPPGPMRRRSRLFLPGGGRDTSTMGGRSRRLIHGTRQLAPRCSSRIFDRAAPVVAARGVDDRSRERRRIAVEPRERATSRLFADVGGLEPARARAGRSRRGRLAGSRRAVVAVSLPRRSRRD